MNYDLKKSNIRGNEEVTLSLTPDDNLETEFFSTLFSHVEDMEFVLVPGTSKQVIIRQKQMVTLPTSS